MYINFVSGFEYMKFISYAAIIIQTCFLKCHTDIFWLKLM